MVDDRITRWKTIMEYGIYQTRMLASLLVASGNAQSIPNLLLYTFCFCCPSINSSFTVYNTQKQNHFRTTEVS